MVDKKVVTRDSLVNDLKNFGVKEGDVLYIKGDLGHVAEPKNIEGKLSHYFIDVLLEAVGNSGTIVTAAYTKSFPFWKVSKNNCFTKESKSYCGTIPYLFLKRKDCVRSTHPTSSYVAIGPKAEYILFDHTPKSLAYEPFKKMLELNAKTLIFGCVGSSPDFPTTHYVEDVLHLAKKNFLHGFSQVYYVDNKGEMKKFKRKDPGSCGGSIAAEKLYHMYYEAGIMKIGKFGQSLAVLSNQRDSYRIAFNALKNNRGFITCDNPLCIYCNLLIPRKKHAVLLFFLVKIWVIIFKMICNVLNNKPWKDVIRKGIGEYDVNKDSIFKHEIAEINSMYHISITD